jgi:hypothetical protein
LVWAAASRLSRQDQLEQMVDALARRAARADRAEQDGRRAQQVLTLQGRRITDLLAQLEETRRD